MYIRRKSSKNSKPSICRRILKTLAKCSISIVFFPLLFVAVACDKREKVNSICSNDVVSEKKSDEYLGSIIHNLLGKKQDSSINFIDPQNDSLVVVFNEIPGRPPYHIETRRLVQEDPNQYLPALEQEMILNEIRRDGLETNFGILMPRKDYLPGERVTWRISAQNREILKEVICCPNPVIIKNSSGDQIMEAALISVYRPTTYALLFPARKENVDFIFTVGMKQSRGMIPAGDLKITTFEPVCEGVHGGISKIELHSNGESYYVELPWGNEIVSTFSPSQRVAQ